MLFKAMFGVVFVFMVTVTSLSEDGFAQTDERHKLSGDLANDPVAQDILEKIERTKRWIQQIEERESAQRDIQEKKRQMLDMLEENLAEWQAEWEHLTFEYRFLQAKNRTSAEYIEANWRNNAAAQYAYNKTLSLGGSEQAAKEAAIDITSKLHGIFFDNLSFTYSKIKEGRQAMKMVQDRGGTGLEAQNAFAEAAQMSISDLVAINAINNVNNRMAYYNQQILFDAEGQFHDLKSGNLLREYYQDYRTVPEYILANPDDPSWKSMGKTESSTECRAEYVLIHRVYEDDYVCTTMATAEMWERHSMGEVIQNPSSQDKTIEQLHNDRINSKIDNVKKKLEAVQASYINQIEDMNQKYEEAFMELDVMKAQEEKNVRDEKRLSDIHERYETEREIMLAEKDHFKELFGKSKETSYQELLDIYEDDEELRIVWDSDEESYQVQRK